MKIRIACIQLNATEDFEHNVAQSIKLAREARHQGAEIVAFPEMFLFRGNPSHFSKIATKTEQAIHKFQQIACIDRLPILFGSVLEKSKARGKYFNSSLLISSEGRIVAHYRKIHLFDVETPNHLKSQESQFILPGHSRVTGLLSGIHFGLTICYDLRFPDQFRKLAKKGAEVIFVPSNFLYETGKAHWHVLLRARAIENQAFIVAPAQVGTHPFLKHKSFGHSLIVDPWGRILAEGSGNKTEVVLSELDLKYSRDLRKKFPVLSV